MYNKPKKPKHYVNNADLLVHLVEYVTEYKIAKKNNLPLPKIPEYVGECILLIATKLSNSPNFYSYSYKEDMIADGIENCISYIHNFNPEKTKNAFSYITQICWFASLRRISKEKKQQEIKSELIKNSGILNMDFDTQFGDDDEYKSNYLEFLQTNLIHDKPIDTQDGRKIIKKTTKAYQAQKKLEEEQLSSLVDFSINETKNIPLDDSEDLVYNTSILEDFLEE